MLADDGREEPPPGGLARELGDAAAARQVDVERLLDDDVEAGGEGLLGEADVQSAGRADDDELGGVVPDHVAEVREDARAVGAQLVDHHVGELVGGGGRDVDERGDAELGVLGEHARVMRADDAAADDRDADGLVDGGGGRALGAGGRCRVGAMHVRARHVRVGPRLPDDRGDVRLGHRGGGLGRGGRRVVDPAGRRRASSRQQLADGRVGERDGIVGDVEGDALLVVPERLERAQLRREQARRHEVALAGAQTLGQQLVVAGQVHEDGVGRGGAEDVAVGALQRAARDDGSALGAPGERAADLLQPGPAVVVVERVALGHLAAVGLRVEVVAVDEGHADILREQIAHRRLPGSGDPHHDHGRERADGVDADHSLRFGEELVRRDRVGALVHPTRRSPTPR